MADEFVPAADEVWRLQRGTDRECRLFQAMADKGHYGAGQGTRQGIYVCSSSGDFLASINSLNPDTVITTLETALRKWQQLPEAVKRRGSAANPMPAYRWETSYPDQGLVLVSVNRDLVAEQSDVRRSGDRWNRDHVWFSAEEARSWLPADPIPGTAHQLPEPLVRRLARFHLVDNVRGQTLPFAVQEVYGSEIQTEVLERRGQLVRLRISGVTMAVAEGPWLMGDNDWKPPREFPRTVAVQLLGYATYDLAQTVFTEFEVVAPSVTGEATRRTMIAAGGRKREPLASCSRWLKIRRQNGFHPRSSMSTTPIGRHARPVPEQLNQAGDDSWPSQTLALGIGGAPYGHGPQLPSRIARSPAPT